MSKILYGKWTWKIISLVSTTKLIFHFHICTTEKKPTWKTYQSLTLAPLNKIGWFSCLFKLSIKLDPVTLVFWANQIYKFNLLIGLVVPTVYMLALLFKWNGSTRGTIDGTWWRTCIVGEATWRLSLWTALYLSSVGLVVSTRLLTLEGSVSCWVIMEKAPKNSRRNTW